MQNLTQRGAELGAERKKTFFWHLRGNWDKLQSVQTVTLANWLFLASNALVIEFQQASGLIQRSRHITSDAQPDTSGTEKFRAWSPNREHLNHKLIVKQNPSPKKTG